MRRLGRRTALGLLRSYLGHVASQSPGTERAARLTVVLPETLVTDRLRAGRSARLTLVR
jgi:hypothetical protein